MLTRARFIAAAATGLVSVFALAGCSFLGIENPNADDDQTTEEELPAGAVDFDDMIVSVATDTSTWTWEKIDNSLSQNNGLLVVGLPITAQNNSDSSRVLSTLYCKVTAPDGTVQADLTGSYPDDILKYGSIYAGSTATGTLHVLFRGRGTYAIDFDNLLGTKATLKVDIDASGTGLRAIPTQLGANDLNEAFASGVTFDMEDMTFTLSADTSSYCWVQASAPGDPVWDARWCVGVPLTVENNTNNAAAVTQDIYAKYGPWLTQVDDPASYFAAGPYIGSDGVTGTSDIATQGLVSAGQGINSMIYWPYDGDGDYYIAFDSNGAKIIATVHIAQYE